MQTDLCHFPTCSSAPLLQTPKNLPFALGMKKKSHTGLAKLRSSPTHLSLHHSLLAFRVQAIGLLHGLTLLFLHSPLSLNNFSPSCTLWLNITASGKPFLTMLHRLLPYKPPTAPRMPCASLTIETTLHTAV